MNVNVFENIESTLRILYNKGMNSCVCMHVCAHTIPGAPPAVHLFGRCFESIDMHASWILFTGKKRDR